MFEVQPSPSRCSPDIAPSGWLGSKHQETNKQASKQTWPRCRCHGGFVRVFVHLWLAVVLQRLVGFLRPAHMQTGVAFHLYRCICRQFVLSGEKCVSLTAQQDERDCCERQPLGAAVSRWRGCNYRALMTNLQRDLADRSMANPTDPVLSHRTFQERQSAAVPELPNDHPHQSPNQSHAEDLTE